MKYRNRRETALPLSTRLWRASGIAVVLGAVVFTVAQWTSESLFFGDLSDVARDLVLSVRADIRAGNNLHAPIVLAAIDDDTYAMLKRPDLTPRDTLAALLDTIAAKKPLEIIVDINIGLNSRTPVQDQLLRRTLEQIASAGIPILLVRQPQGRSPGLADQIAATPFDDAVAANPAIDWVSAPALAGADGVARRMLVWDRACAGGRPRYLINVSLLAALIARTSATPKAIASDMPKPEWTCSQALPAEHASIHLPLPLLPDGDGVEARHAELITYTLKWPAKPVSAATVTDRHGHVRPLLRVVSAKDFLSGAGSDIADSLFADSIVMIGATHSASPDWTATPVGEMPGVFALINNIRGLADFGIEQEASFWTSLTMTLLLALATADLMVLAGETFAPWVEFLLPFALTAIWVGLLVLGFGEGLYFSMSLVPLLVGGTVLSLPERLKHGAEPGGHKEHKGKVRRR